MSLAHDNVEDSYELPVNDLIFIKVTTNERKIYHFLKNFFI